MKPRESMVRLKFFQVREKKRQISQLDMMIKEFERVSSELERQISAEEQKSGVYDVEHFAYSTFARAARLRRKNLLTSINELMIQKAAVEKTLAEVQEELDRALALEERDGHAISPENLVFIQRRSMIG